MTPPRAAVVYDCLYPFTTGGGERVYRRMAELLAARGYAVDYLTRRQWDGPDPDGLPFRVIPIWQGELSDAAGDRRIAAAIGFARAVHRRLRADGGYDVVVASALPVLTLLAARLALGRRAASTLVADWLEVWTRPEWRRYSGPVAGMLAWALQAMGARSARVNTVNSAFTARRLRASGCPRPIIELGLVDFGGPARRPVEVSDPPSIAVVGRLIPDKRVDLVLRSLAEARRELPALGATVVGEGPDRARLEALSVELGLAEAVRFTGRIEDDELDRVLARSAALVSGSRREGFGLVVVEAAARGIPSIVVDAPGNAAAELVSRENGRRVGEDAIADAIVEVVRAGDALRESAAAWYRAAAVARRLDASLTAVLAALSGAAGAPGRE